MKTVRLLLYKDVYKDNNKSVDELLKLIPSKLSLQLLSRIQFQNKELHDLNFELEFLKSIIGLPNYNSIEPILLNLIEKFNISIFDTFTTLTFIENVLKNYKDEVLNQRENETLSFFKVYLLINQDLDNSYSFKEILNGELS